MLLVQVLTSDPNGAWAIPALPWAWIVRWARCASLFSGKGGMESGIQPSTLVSLPSNPRVKFVLALLGNHYAKTTSRACMTRL